jgi:hypothetical protein
MHTPSRERLAASVLLLGVALTATYPLFIETYRSMAFQTFPRDDYAPYLLWLAGDGSSMPGSPMVYRVLSVAIALPFYFALPVYRFTNLTGIDVAYLRASQALAFTSWLALAGLAVLVYRTSRDRLGASPVAALVAFFAAPLYAQYTGMAGIDPLAMLLIAAAYYWLRAPAAFAPIVIASAAFNEKVPLVFALLLAGRVLAAPRETLRRYPGQILACACAVLGYLAVRHFSNIPGWERQLQPTTYLDSALAILKLTLSSKGVFQNLLPVALVLGVYAFVWRRRDAVPAAHWSRADVAVPIGLLAVGVAINVEYTLGRLVAHALPLVAPAAAAALEAGAASRAVEWDDAPERPDADPSRLDLDRRLPPA